MAKHPTTFRSLSVTAHESDLIAKALRAHADRLLKADDVDVEEARSLDRALRCCPGISDIDVVWVPWSYIGGQRGWLTADEIVRTKTGRNTYLPEKASDGT